MKPVAKVGMVLGIIALTLFLTVWIAGVSFRHGGSTDQTQPSVNFQVGKTKTRSSMSSTSTSSSSDNDCFASGQLWIVVDDSHELSRRVGALLSQQLKQLPSVDRIEVAKSGELPADGAESPDLFLNIHLVSLQKEGPLSGTTKATMTASLGSSPWQSHHYSHNSATPPLVQFDWNATLECESTFTGIRSDRYKDVATSIAGQFARGMSNEIQKLARKFPPLPDLPKDLYGAYIAAPDFNFLNEVRAVRACSYHGVLTHNETFWRFQAATNPVPQLQRIVAQLASGGWRLLNPGSTNAENYYIEARRKQDSLEIFRVRDHPGSLSLPAGRKTAPEFIVHYRRPFSKEELAAAVDNLFAHRKRIETLLPFYNSFSRAQREQFYEWVEKTPTVSPAACVRAAQGYLSRRDTNAALHMLLRAKTLAAAWSDSPSVESEIRSIAGKISRHDNLKLEITPAICRALGFFELTNGAQTVECERNYGRPLVFFRAAADGLKIVSFTIRAPQKGVYPWMCKCGNARLRI